MPNALTELSANQFRRAAEIKEQIDALNRELNEILGGASERTGVRKDGRKMSPAARARIGAAQRKRWAKQKGGQPVAKTSGRKGGGRMSAEGRARIAAGVRARWAKAKAAGKSKL